MAAQIILRTYPRHRHACICGILALAGALLLVLAVSPLSADDQSEAVSEAMQPPPVSADEKPPQPSQPPAAEETEETEQKSPEPAETPEEQQPPPADDKPAEEEAPTALQWPELPKPSPDSEIISLRADDFYYQEGVTEAWGDLQGAYQDYTFEADYLRLDKERTWLELKDHVTIQKPTWITRGDRLRMNLDTDEWTLRDGTTTVAPSFFEEGVLEPLYLYAGDITGRPGHIEVDDGLGTSCDKAERHQHYWLQSSDISVRPGDEVVFHKPTLYLLGHRVFRYPFDLRLSLKERRNRFIPEFGENEVEGYYAKLAYLYYISEAHSGFARYQTTEKRGMGFGVDHAFDFVDNYGNLRIFAEPDEGSFSGRLADQHEFNTHSTARLNSNIQRYSGYGYGSTSLNSNLTFRTRSTGANSTIGFSHSLMDSDFNTTRRYSMDFDHTQKPSEDLSWSVQTAMSRNDYGRGDAPDEELNADFRMRGRQTAYDWETAFKKRYDLDGGDYTGDDSFYSLDQEPQIIFNSDTERLAGFTMFGGNPLQTSLRLGRFHQQPDDKNISRARLDLSMPGSRHDLGGRNTVRTSARFRQSFYDEGSAQWSSDLSTTLQGPISRPWEYRLTMSHSTVHGNAPLRLDYASRRTAANVQFVSVVEDDMRIDISSGYDFVNDYYSDARLRAAFLFGAQNRIELQSGYSLERAMWRPLNLRWLRGTDDWYSALTTYYDLDRDELTRASTEINWRVNDLWYIALQAGYDGYQDEFDQLDVKLVRELHCMRASLTYNKELNEFRFNIGIKAFPSDQRPLSVGSGGSQFESTFSPSY